MNSSDNYLIFKGQIKSRITSPSIATGLSGHRNVCRLRHARFHGVDLFQVPMKSGTSGIKDN
jgi:hypothetical protein